ncbi:hypothetical protein U879_08475 [Defluviimonas sp. 20V17]|uniref:Uncharacterized protein n=1 Tax=Allgaiera indica TaxID=765699 RepID=A0AAN4UVE8_9RHOB|nr:hypothetical protein [Allgaiera indica]KDB04120.1 hypothetical protein U879_08475 [Defluviimonas sp. 20V17]GHE06513.1 hypothetical protein GCM10008024_41050 [Allgaiera indica]SDX96924.1 hypothetical protein SAMN05444006_1563 [Allgaiera indica]
MNGAVVLSVRYEAAAVFEQIAFEWFDADGVSRTQYIDLVVQQVDGRWIGCAVRPLAKVTQKYLAKRSRIKAQAIQQGFLFDFRLFTKLDLPGKSGEHQLRNQEVFDVQRETTDAGISA